MAELNTHLASKASISVRVAQALLPVNSGIWIIFGLVSLVRIPGSATISPITAWIIALLIVANAALMLGIAWGLEKNQKLFNPLGIAFISINLLLTITDDFGLFDLLALCIDLALLIALIVARRR